MPRHHSVETVGTAGQQDVDDGAAHLSRIFPDGPPAWITGGAVRQRLTHQCYLAVRAMPAELPDKTQQECLPHSLLITSNNFGKGESSGSEQEERGGEGQVQAPETAEVVVQQSDEENVQQGRGGED